MEGRAMISQATTARTFTHGKRVVQIVDMKKRLLQIQMKVVRGNLSFAPPVVTHISTFRRKIPEATGRPGFKNGLSHRRMSTGDLRKKTSTMSNLSMCERNQPTRNEDTLRVAKLDHDTSKMYSK
jgi:hypothetical protein